jgi:cytochrome c peroxidase
MSMRSMSREGLGRRAALARSVLGLVITALGLTGCGGGDGSADSDAGNPAGSGSVSTPSLAAVAGKALFFDKSLSASGAQSCGTCHVPSFAFAADPTADHGLPVPLGGPNMDQTGLRNAPSLLYASFTPPFSSAGGPVGGFFRDGRASSLATQAQQPFVTAFEMANKDASEVVSRLRQSTATLQAFVAAYGESALEDPKTALRDIGLALAAFETEDPAFHPFTSKFDYWQQGRVQLTARELKGLELFNNPGKGNCTACHPSQAQGFSSHPLFTDFTYDNIGVPRNWNIPANTPGAFSPISGGPLVTVLSPRNLPPDAEYAYYDMGLCGPLAPSTDDVNARPDLSASTSLCGLFKVPTLRNVALTAPYFHNGVFTTLHQVVEWYVTRDVNPAAFYKAADGSPDVSAYNDLPVAYDANVNAGEVPYTPPASAGGQSPTLTSDEIDAVVAFLCTLTDGFDPDNLKKESCE